MLSFPKYFSVQTTSLCNASCVFCPYEEIENLFPKKIMEMALYRRIIDECSNYENMERLILYMNNEPLTDPYLVERINYAKEKLPWASVHILTNGLLLTDEMAEKLINSKLDWIGISFHGIRKETIERAMGMPYEPAFKRINNFIEKAKEEKNIREYVMITFLKHKYLTCEEKEETINFWKSKGIERISYFDGPISRASNVKDLSQVRHEKIKGCASIWANEMIHIVENGDVILCCMDWRREVILGNVNKQSIYEVWNGALYQVIREKVRGEIPTSRNFICKRCEEAIVETGELDFKKAQKKEIDILLTTSPPWGINNPPIGLAYLHSYLKEKGIEAEIFDFNIYCYNNVDKAYKNLWHVENKNYWSNEYTYSIVKEMLAKHIDYCVDRILSADSDLVGFSVVDPKERLTIDIIKKVKDRDPAKKIILGGPACSTEAQRQIFLDNILGYIDAFVVGEGEETLFEIVQRYKSGKGLENLPGAVTKCEDGRWKFVPREPIVPLDNIPFPTYEGFDLDSYLSNTLIVEWSRGCIGRCSFCKNYRLVKGYRSRSHEHIFKELKYHLKQNRINEFTVCDPLMNGDLRQLNGICDLIVNDECELKWTGQIVPRRDMSYELLVKMKKAGCYKLQIGVESGSDLVLNRMRKTYISKDAERVIRDAHRTGIITEIFIMVGFPGEGEDEFNETVEFIKRNSPYIDTVKSINTLHLIAGTDVYENYRDYGVVDLPLRDWHYRWQTDDGNDYSIRRDRGERLLATVQDFGVRVLETNLKEGKEKALVGGCYGAGSSVDEKIERLKLQINDLQRFGPVEDKGIKRRSLRYFAKAFVRDTKGFGLIYTLKKTARYITYRMKGEFRSAIRRSYKFIVIVFLLILAIAIDLHLWLLKRFRRTIVFPGG